MKKRIWLICLLTALVCLAFGAAGADDVTVGDLTYSVDAAAGYAYVKACDPAATSVTVASEIEGVPVAAIGKEAFRKCQSLKTAVLPAGITKIDDYAFCGCGILTEFTIPAGVKSIGEAAFCCCFELKKITVPGSVTTLGEYAFDSCTGLTELKLSSGLKTLSDYAVCNCCKLTEVTVPDTVKSLGTGVFDLCDGLVTITIPAGVTKIGHSAVPMNAEILCYKGSAAETWAIENGRRYSYLRQITLPEKQFPSTGSDPVLVLKKGAKFTLKPSAGSDDVEFSFTSSKKSVAKVSSSGVITAVKKGTATVTVSVKGESGTQLKLKVIVGSPVTKLKLSKTKITLKKGKTQTLKVTVTPAKPSVKALKWTSSNTKVATVDRNGKVKALKKGKCKITCEATDGSGVKVTCTVTVR